MSRSPEDGAAQPLQVKLHIPRPGPGAVSRSRLTERLNAALACGGRLTTVIAPAGYGKSSLLADWVTASGRATAWLRLDHRDNHLPVFLRYVVAALRTQFPEACPVTSRASQVASVAPPEYLAELLAGELTDLPRPLTLVLDDCHVIRAPEVLACMARLLEILPDTVHLALVGRVDPPLPLKRIRVQGQLCELRGEDLRFTLPEATEFLILALGAGLAPEIVSALHERTEGWIALLQLSAQSLRNRPELAESVGRILAQMHRQAAGYLLEEFLAQQTEAAQDFLLKTSILEAFCAPLSAAVAGIDDIRVAEAYLVELPRLNPLLLELDDRQYWYRYHRLLQDFLQGILARRLAPEEIADLHRRASAWYAACGLIDEALDHALAAGDNQAAMQLVEGSVAPAARRGEVLDLERRLGRLPPHLVSASPALLFGEFFVAQARDEVRRMPALLEAIEAGLQRADWQPGDDLRQFVTGISQVGWSLYYRYANQSLLSQQHAERALNLLPRSDAWAYGTALLYWGAATQALGRGPEAVSRLREELATVPSHDLVYLQLILFALANVHRWSGEMSQLAETAGQMLHIAQQAGIVIRLGWARTMLGIARYQTNDLEAARSLFAAVVAEPAVAHILALRDAVACLALTYQAQGLPQQANAVVSDHLEVLRRTQRLGELSHAHALQALLALRQGDLRSAEKAVELAAIDPDPGIIEWLVVPRLVEARVLLARGDTDSVRQALAICNTVAARAEALHNIPKRIETHALRALICEAQGQTPEALRELRTALQLGLPGGHVRIFLDLEMPTTRAPSIQRLLQTFGERSTPARLGARLGSEQLTQYVLSLLDACRPMPRSAVSPQAAVDGATIGMVEAATTPRTPFSSRVVGASADPAVEPLTDRELEVLQLLAQRYSAKEIAAQLIITPGTAKRHCANIYDKLAARSRGEAVARARQLGILSDR